MLSLILALLVLAFYFIYYLRFQRKEHHIDKPEKQNYICPYCKSSVEDGDLICPYCYKPLIRRCRSCGEWTFLGYDTCHKCGGNLITLINKGEKV